MTFAPMRFGAQPWSESSCQPHTRHPSGTRGPTRSEMAARLVELHRVLKPTGSLYLHYDPTASHYLKIVLAAIFGPAQFINEIAWKRTGVHSSANHYGPNFDTLLFYAKGSAWTRNQQFGPYDDHYVRENYRHADATGRLWRRDNLTAPETRPGTLADYEWKGFRPPQGRHWAVRHEQRDEWDATGRIVYSSSGYPQYKRYLDEMLSIGTSAGRRSPVEPCEWAGSGRQAGMFGGSGLRDALTNQVLNEDLGA